MSIPPTEKKEKSIFLINQALFIGIFYEVKSSGKDGGGPKPAAGFSAPFSILPDSPGIHGKTSPVL